MNTRNHTRVLFNRSLMIWSTRVVLWICGCVKRAFLNTDPAQEQTLVRCVDQVSRFLAVVNPPA